ncbi:MAG: 3'-5' exonuclease [Planctomycetes bacterium]|nr:3'-5' exonuclease [Planctomycetota bacterium]
MSHDPFFPDQELPPPGWLVFDCESIPDGKLLNIVKYPTEKLTPEESVARAQAEANANSGSDFLPVTFHLPIAITVLRVGVDFSLQAIACLDAPQYRPRNLIEQFWAGLVYYHHHFDAQVKMVTFNGRGFDLPLLEMAAFRYGLSAPQLLSAEQKRYADWHLDLMDWLTNYGAIRLSGGLNLLSKLLGKPGKTEVTGKKVYPMWRDAKIAEINDYCLCDTLDTYFVFLRTRVMSGALALDQEQLLIRRTKDWLRSQTAAFPVLAEYVTLWEEWRPWP